MKYIFLITITLIGVSPTLLHPMFFSSPEELYTAHSKIALQPAEQYIILDAINKRGAKSVKHEIDNLEFPMFIMENIFHKDEGLTNSHIKNVYDIIEAKEKTTEDAKTKPFRHLGALTTYRRLNNPCVIHITTKTCNLQAVLDLLS